MSKQAIIQKHQAIIDLAIQYGGSAELLFELANANGISLTDEIAPGTLLIVPDPAIVTVYDYLRRGQYRPITVLPDDNALIGEGIEFWAIENEFIVS